MSDQWMGSIAAQDQYRPLGNDPWTNTMRGTPAAPGQGFAPVEPVLYHTASPLVNITEGDISRATDVAMGATAGGLKGQQIKAYHSSPHDFDKFDLAKIGTGEGAQVYGHGLYFAENPAVSGQGGQYWNQFLNKFGGTPEGHAASRLKSKEFDRVKALEFADRDVRDWQSVLSGEKSSLRNDPAYAEKMLALRQAERDLLASGKPVGPRTYEVNIKADPAHMLDWDKKIGQQPKAVQDYFRKQIKQFGPEAAMEAQIKIAGSRAGGLRPVSEGLAEAGIPGIKYLDEGSRGQSSPYLVQKMLDEAKAGLATAPKDKIDWHTRNVDLHERMLKDALKPSTSNYVVFDPSIIDIMKKYGIAGAAPTAMGALAAQDTYRGD